VIQEAEKGSVVSAIPMLPEDLVPIQARPNTRMSIAQAFVIIENRIRGRYPGFSVGKHLLFVPWVWQRQLA